MSICNSSNCDKLDGCFIDKKTNLRELSGFKDHDIPKFLKVRHSLKKKEDLTEDIKTQFYKSTSTPPNGKIKAFITPDVLFEVKLVISDI